MGLACGPVLAHAVLEELEAVVARLCGFKGERWGKGFATGERFWLCVDEAVDVWRAIG